VRIAEPPGVAIMDLVAHTYEVDEVRLTGFLADGATRDSVPGVLLAHEAPGVTDHVKQRAKMLAERGYVAFALDMYGQADLPLDEAREQSRRLMADAALLRRRARAALDVLASQVHCDATKLAAVGFCLGGIVALELARDRAPIRCAVGFHPGFKRPVGSATGAIAAKVLMIIGDDDPVVPAEDRADFVQEMKDAGADWQLHVFGGVGHSYTNRVIDALGYPGFAYNEQADRRAWNLMLALFDEIF
jgi:dienelactone hydrolase